MNTITIIGHLGKDAVVRETSNGSKFLSFSVADNQYVKGERKTYWYDVISFNYNEKLAQYYKQGSNLVITGSLVCDTDTGKDGVTRCRRSINAYSIEFVPGKSENSANTEQGTVKDNSSSAQPSMYSSKQKDEVAEAPKAKVAPKVIEVEDADTELPF